MSTEFSTSEGWPRNANLKPVQDELAPDRSSTVPPLRRIELFFIFGFWAFIAVLTFVNALMNDAVSPGPHLPPMAPLVAAIINCLIWAMLTPLLFRLTARFSLDKPGWIVHSLLLLALGLALSICVAKFMTYVRFEQAVYYTQTRSGAPGLAVNFDIRSIAQRFWFMNEFVIYLVIVAGGFAHNYFLRYRARHEQANSLQAQTALLRAELADARLSALRSQLNPHFLFNTLNTVSSLLERNPRGARRMIAQLSALLREALEGTGLEVPLEKELALVRRYVDIMRTRFHGRLETVESIAPETLNAIVPNFILQPLVENAIKHGVEKLEGVGRIEIKARRSGDLLHLSVLNNGAMEFGKRLHETGEGMGLGLKNTQARLAQAYGDKQSLTLRSRPGGVIAEITLPFQTGRPTEICA